MSQSRSDQRWQKVAEGVQRVAFRPTCAEKVRRLEATPLLGLSNLLTSSNLAARRQARTPAYMRMRMRARACVCIPVRWVRRLGSRLIVLNNFRPTSANEVGKTKGGWTNGN